MKSEWQLQVNRTQFIKALRSTSRAGRAVAGAEAILRFEDGELILDLAGVSCRVPAVGEWPPEVRVPGGFLKQLVTRVPDIDPLPISVKDGRFYLARFAVRCTTRSRNLPTPINELIPANAETFEILMAQARCSAEEIDAGGATPLVTAAQTKLQAACAKAAALLSRYRVTPAALEAMCERHIEDGSRRFREADAGVVRQIAAAWQLLAPYGAETDELWEVMQSCLRQGWENPK